MKKPEAFKPVKEWHFRVLMIVISLIVTLVLAEIAVSIIFNRATLGRQNKETFKRAMGTAFANDNVLPFRLIPGTYDLGSGKTITINSLGYRGQKFARKKHEGIIRILFLGDSFTYGFAMDDEDTLPRLVEKHLLQHFSNVEVINAGFHGGSQQQYELYLKTEGFSLDPDIIVISSLADNDITDSNFNYVMERGEDGLPTKISDGLRALNGFRYYTTLPIWLYEIPVLKRSTLWYHFLLVFHRIKMGKRKPITEERIREFFDGSMLRIRKMCEERDIRIRHWLVIGSSVNDENHEHYAYMRSFFKKYEIPYLDIGKEFLKCEKKEYLLKSFISDKYEWDLHLNKRGNEIFAEAGTKDLMPILQNINRN